MTVYVLTEGDYSGYGISGVTLDYEEAIFWLNDKLKSSYPDSPRIEEYETDSIVRPRDKDKKVFYAYITKNGAVRAESAFLAGIPGKVHKNWRGYLSSYVYAKSAEQAKKIIQDLVAEYKANRV